MAERRAPTALRSAGAAPGRSCYSVAMKRRRLRFASVLLLLGAACSDSAVDSPKAPYAFPADSAWLSGFQVFVYGQPPLEYLQAVRGSVITWSVYHAGVNDAELAYVRQLHGAGIRLASNHASMQGSVSVTGDDELNRATACVSFDGKPTFASWIVPDPPYLPCNNNPRWLEFLQTRAYEHAGAEVDALHIDEVEGIAGHLYTAGFDEHCLRGFREYLRARHEDAELAAAFGITAPASFDYRQYLIAQGANPGLSGPVAADPLAFDPRPALRREYVRFQLFSRRDSMRAMIENTRAHRADRYVAFTANTFFLNANKMPFVDDLDFLIFENTLEFPPAGKHFGEHALARAAAPGKPSAMFPNIFNLLDFRDGKHWGVYLHWVMEAFASGEHFLLPHNAYVFGGGQESVSGNVTMPPKLFRPYADFMARHWAAHDAARMADTAVVFPYGTVLAQYVDKGYATPWAISEPAHLRYLDLARQLQADHIPFETIFVGDGELVRRPLPAHAFDGYAAVVVPTLETLDAATEGALKAFAAEGGKVFRTERLDAAALAALHTPLLGTDAPATLSIAPAFDGNAVYVHLVNYDYRRDAAQFEPAPPAKVTVTLPAELAARAPRAVLSRPGIADRALELVQNGSRATFTIDSVTDYGLVRIGE